MSAININAAVAPRSRGFLIASTIIVLLFVVGAIGGANRKPITEGFDELVHVSYVAYLQAADVLWPHLDQVKVIDPASFQFTAATSYLNHPPFYYWLMAAAGPDVTGQPSSLMALRLLNVAIAALGLIALLALADRMQLSRHELYAFAIAIAASPVLPPLAGSVNNDNLGFAGGAVAILGAYGYLASSKRSWLIVACGGMLLASAAKLTGLMLTGGFLAALLVLAALARKTSRIDTAIVAGSLLVAAIPYLVFTLQYGSPAPNTLGQAKLLHDGAEAAGWANAPRMGAMAYAVLFLKNFLMEWMPTLRARNEFQLGLLILPVATLGLAAAGIVTSLRAIIAGSNRPFDLIVVAGAMAIIATLGLHILFSYQRHLQTGWMLDAYPRYYLPMIAIVPMAALGLISAIGSPGTRTLLLWFLIASPLIFGLFGAPLG